MLGGPTFRSAEVLRWPPVAAASAAHKVFGRGHGGNLYAEKGFPRNQFKPTPVDDGPPTVWLSQAVPRDGTVSPHRRTGL